MSQKNYRLIWFQHLSKAAGSSIVHLAIINGEVLYPHHSNGNPRNSNGKLVRPWEMDAVELSGFVDHCESKGITFISTEWGAPDFTILSSDPRVTLITCMRDPLERFISNFYFALYSGTTDRRSPEDYLNSVSTLWGIYTMSNYYCRIFSRYHNNPKPVGQNQFELAKSNLSLFDCRILLKDKGSFSYIKSVLGWTGKEIHTNRTKLDILSLTKHVAKGEIHSLWRRFAYPRKEPNENFIHLFRKQNQWDYKLYQEAKINVPY